MKLSRIPALKDNPNEIARLRAAEIEDQEELQKKIDGNSGSMFHSLEASTGLSKPRLLQVIQQSLDLSARPRLTRRVRDHAIDLIVAAVVAVFVLQFVYPPKRPSQVIASSDIPAFHQIQAADLEEIPPKKPPFDTSRQYAGKYSLDRISKNSRLSDAKLAAALVELRVEIKSSAVADNATMPQPVLLVLSARPPATGGTAMPALLSKIEMKGNSRIATLQIPFGQQAELAKWLGSGDAYIMLRIP